MKNIRLLIIVFYLKLLRINSWVISLYSSSLKVENTFKSPTNISTAFGLSCLKFKKTTETKQDMKFYNEYKFI
jgi:hypothetical protein